MRKIKNKEIKKAFFIVWITITIITAVVIALPFVVNEETFLNKVPECSLKLQTGQECSFCGMTRAFFHLSKGYPKKAFLLNKGSVVLYSSIIINFIIFIYVLIKRGRK